jgi:hypothetical protein
MKLPSVQELIKNVDSAERQTNGPNRYVVGSMKQLIYSIAHFEETTKKTEKVMIFLATAQVILAIAQVTLAVVQLFN